ncbi:MAG: hypothetical protein M3619_00700 [Myxococcota bacterium]|nr:hypothetical protein [Myxococcota bacterium]
MSPKKRKQMQIPGTERTEIPDIEVAAEAYREIRDERSELSRGEAQKKAELLALMRVHKTKKYRYHDGNGEELEVIIDDEPKVKVRKTGEAESEIGEGVDVGPGLSVAPPVHEGLIAQAMRAQDGNVEEDEDGDVVVPDTAAPKGKAKRRKAKRS